MKLPRTVLMSGLALALCGGASEAPAAQAPAKMITLQIPATPDPGDIRITNTAQDRFYNTDLDKELKAKGIKTLIMVGWKISGSVTYTSVGAMAHDYTVAIPMDTTSAGSDYETIIGFYNVLNSGNANLPNQPLKPTADR